jgi:glutathione synthase/RimK-type ligase-like ATP-grasp enzyme
MLQEIYYDAWSFFSLITWEKYPIYDLCRIGAQWSKKYALLAKWLIYYYQYLHNVPVVDNISSLSLSYNKFTQQITLDYHWLAKLHTQFYVLSTKYLDCIIEKIESTFSYPVVVKNPILERWLWVELIVDWDYLYKHCLDAIAEGWSMSNILVQQFFVAPNDYRAVVVWWKILGVFSKSNPDGFKHNVAQWGKIASVVLSELQKRTIITAVSYMWLDVCWVDFFMNDDGDLIFIEFNDIPQYSGLEETSWLSFIQEFQKRVEERLA